MNEKTREKLKKNINQDALAAAKAIREHRLRMFIAGLSAIRVATQRGYSEDLISDIASLLYACLCRQVRVEECINIQITADAAEKTLSEWDTGLYSGLITDRAMRISLELDTKEGQLANLIEHLLDTKGEPRCPSNTKQSEIRFTVKE